MVDSAICVILKSHPRLGFKSLGLAGFTHSQLHWTANDSPLCSSFRFAFFDKEPPVWSEITATFVADKASIVPLPAYRCDDNIVHDMLFAALTARSGAPRVTSETPGVSVFFYKWRLLGKGLLSISDRTLI